MSFARTLINELSFDEEKEYESVEIIGGRGDVNKKIAKEICSASKIKKEKELNTTSSFLNVEKLLFKAKETAQQYETTKQKKKPIFNLDEVLKNARK